MTIKDALMGQAFMLPSYALIALAINAPTMGVFWILIAWDVVAILVGAVAGVLWAKRPISKKGLYINE